MDTNLLKYQAFVTTVELGSFTRAAQTLGYAQSSISKMIADLEAEWKVTLLERSRGGTVPTSDGLAMLPYARDLLQSYQKVQEMAASLSGVVKGMIRIGTFSSVATHWLPRFIQKYQQVYPGIRYELLLGDYAEIERWIFEGRVDCGFLRLPTRPELTSMFLERDEYVLVLPAGHPLTEKETLSPCDLHDQAFLLLEHGGKTEVSEFLERHRVLPDIRFTTWDDYAILSMVEGGLGIAMLPRLILSRIPYRVEIRSFTEPYYREIGLAMRKESTPSAAEQKYVDYLPFRNASL